jgi:hypothetical protein
MRAAVLVAAMAMGSVTKEAAAASAGCDYVNANPIQPGFGGLAGATFWTGDTLSITPTADTTVSAPGVSVFIAATTTGTVVIATTGSQTISLAPGTNITWSCVSGPTPTPGGSGGTDSSSPTNPINQSVANAKTAIQNGQQTLQNLNDWISKGVMVSFGVGTGNTGSAKAAQKAQATSRLTPVSAQAKVHQLQREERELVEERAERETELPWTKAKIAELDQRLASVRRDLMYARSTADIAATRTETSWRNYQPTVPDRERTALTEAQLARERMAAADRNKTPGQRATESYDGAVGSAPRAPTPQTAFGFNARDLAEACDDECITSFDMLGKQWNAWIEGRFFSAVDSLASSNGRGFVGSIGGDYKFLPWLAVGMSVGIETFETNFGSPGMRTGATGFSFVPYVGMRLSDNISATGFVGLTSLAYNNNPLAGVTSRFNALRWLLGGSLTGVWRDGNWRFQPTLQGTYGNEQQYAYTDSAGNSVPSLTVTYGRLSLGPEVGYTFWGTDRSWSIEPFVLAKGNIDFTSSNTTILNGVAVSLRPGTIGSGSLGGGVELRMENGLYFRLQGAYESIGVTGLDVWTGLVRGGMIF